MMSHLYSYIGTRASKPEPFASQTGKHIVPLTVSFRMLSLVLGAGNAPEDSDTTPTDASCSAKSSRVGNFRSG